jgi:hypothetical protein
MEALPLLRRTQLKPDESLHSLLERLAQLNFYPNVRTLDQICRKRQENPVLHDALARPRQAETFFHLAALTQISPDALFAASNHRFAPVVTPPGHDPESMVWPGASPKPILPSHGVALRQVRRVAAAQFCPLCLHTELYHRLSWMPVAAAICLTHQCLLHDHCPCCGNPISVAEITQGHCQKCRADLRTAPVISVAEDEIGVFSQQAIQYWLTLTTEPAPTSLPDHSSVALYRLFDGLRQGLFTSWKGGRMNPAVLGDWAELLDSLPNRSAADQCYVLGRAAFTGILDWPEGLFHFLDTYHQHNNSKKIHYRLGPLHRWFWKTWQYPDFEFVHQALVEYLSARHFPLPTSLVERFKDRAWFAKRTRLWNAEYAAQVLGIAVQDLHRFVNPVNKYTRKGLTLFDGDWVLFIKQRWGREWPLQYVCFRLGLPSSDVFRLVELNLLTVPKEFDQNNPYRWMFSCHSVEAFFEQVNHRLMFYQGAPSELKDLVSASVALSWAEIRRADLLCAALEGVLPAYKLEPSSVRLDQVYFSFDSILSFSEILSEQHSWVTQLAFAWQHNICPHTVTRWVEAGKIIPSATFGRLLCFDPKSLEQLAAEQLGQSRYL